MSFHIERRDVNDTSLRRGGTEELLSNRLLSLVNLPFTAVLIGLYIWKLINKNTKYCSMFLASHIFMYLTIFCSLAIYTCHMNIEVNELLNATLSLAVVYHGSIQFLILIFQYITIISSKIVALIVVFILTILRLLYNNDSINMSFFDKVIRFGLPETFLLMSTIACTLGYFLTLKLATRTRVDQKTISVFIHSIVFVSFYTVCQKATSKVKRNIFQGFPNINFIQDNDIQLYILVHSECRYVGFEYILLSVCLDYQCSRLQLGENPKVYSGSRKIRV
ncbi:unnamed protein product [Caenorhabditis brenneri]